MQIRRLTAAAVAGLALAGLAGCRTAPNVAAYVGDDQVSVAELESAVEDRLADDVIAEGPGADRETFTRAVLYTLVQNDVHEGVAAEYGVEVDDREVRDLLDVLLDGRDPEQAFQALAEQQGRSRQDILAEVRRLAIRLAVAEEEGLSEPLSEEALQARYEQARSEAATIEFGYITVPDEETADQVVAALEADPDRYADLASRFAGDFTVPVRSVPQEELPAELADEALAAEPNTAFAVPIEAAGGVVVGFVGEFPSFDELRKQLETQSISEVDEAVQPVVQEFRDGLEVTVNPRYGELGESSIDLPDDGVVRFLEG